MTVTPWEVEPYDGWASPADARTQWADAENIPDPELIRDYLQPAYEQCLEFAPELATGQTVIPARLLKAQIMQARALWRSQTAGSGDQFGGPDGLTVTVFPMDWTVKSLLRPAHGRPVVG